MWVMVWLGILFHTSRQHPWQAPQPNGQRENLPVARIEPGAKAWERLSYQLRHRAVVYKKKKIQKIITQTQKIITISIG